MSLSRLVLVALALTFFLVASGGRDARADQPGPRAYPVFVLAIDSDDAEDQADALTTALRSRVRTAPGWSLSETTVTLSMLTAALKCPRTPDQPCLAKIAEQLKADRFVWGQMQKLPGNRVKVDLHLWSRNKAESHASETYADNLKDFTDDRLLRIAQRLFDRLTGTISTGALVIHAGESSGSIFVDGQRHGSLANGDATIELPAGTHTVEVRAQGFNPSNDTVTVVPGKETRLNVNLVATEAPPAQTSGGPSGRKVAGWASVGLGTALVVASGVETALYFGKKSDQNGDLSHVPRDQDACKVDPATPVYGAFAKSACDRSKEAKQASALAVVFGAGGAVALVVGIYLLATDGGSSAEKPTSPKFEDRAFLKKVRVMPDVSASAQGLTVVGAF